MSFIPYFLSLCNSFPLLLPSPVILPVYLFSHSVHHHSLTLSRSPFSLHGFTVYPQLMPPLWDCVQNGICATSLSRDYNVFVCGCVCTRRCDTYQQLSTWSDTCGDLEWLLHSDLMPHTHKWQMGSPDWTRSPYVECNVIGLYHL